MQRRERSRAVVLVAPAYERCVAALAACRTTDEVREMTGPHEVVRVEC